MPHPDGDGDPRAEVAAGIVAAAELTAARLVARGESELMLARADAARIQAEARQRLAQAVAREQTFPGQESLRQESPPADDDVAFQLAEEARRQAAEIVADARTDARRILEEAQRLLESLRRQEGSPRADSQNETEAPPEPDASPSPPPGEPDVVVDDRDTGTKASPYSRPSVNLPSMGDTGWRG